MEDISGRLGAPKLCQLILQMEERKLNFVSLKFMELEDDIQL